MKRARKTPKLAIGPGTGRILWFDGNDWVSSDPAGDDVEYHVTLRDAIFSAWHGDLELYEAKMLVDHVLDAIDLLKQHITFRHREKYNSDYRTQSSLEFYIKHIQPILRPVNSETKET